MRIGAVKQAVGREGSEVDTAEEVIARANRLAGQLNTLRERGGDLAARGDELGRAIDALATIMRSASAPSRTRSNAAVARSALLMLRLSTDHSGATLRAAEADSASAVSLDRHNPRAFIARVLAYANMCRQNPFARAWLADQLDASVFDRLSDLLSTSTRYDSSAEAMVTAVATEWMLYREHGDRYRQPLFDAAILALRASGTPPSVRALMRQYEQQFNLPTALTELVATHRQGEPPPA